MVKRRTPIGPSDLSGSRRRRCSARKTNGQPCTKWPIRGGSVCDTHGGSAPQVKRAARRRLAELVDPSIGVLHALLTAVEQHPTQALTAARDVLDRTGHKATEQLDILSTHTLVDPEQVRHMTTEEIRTLVPLLKKLAGRPVDDDAA